MSYDTWIWEDYDNWKAAQPRIRTRNICPPIPLRQFDWCAWIDGEEERQEYGYGRTEAEAISDLVNNYLTQE